MAIMGTKAATALLAVFLSTLQVTPVPGVGPCDPLTEFFMIFMENSYTPSKIPQNPQIDITSGLTEDAAVWTSAPKHLNYLANQSWTLRPHESVTVQPDRAIKLAGTGVSENVAHVLADGFVNVLGLEVEDNSMDGYLALPHTLLGTSYFLVTFADVEGTCMSDKCEAAIVATADATAVSIAIPSWSKVADVTLNSVTYANGSVLYLTMNRFQVLQIQSVHDLTGVVVKANESIAVFSGNVKSRVGSYTQTDHLVEQLLPLHIWGTEFALAPSPLVTVPEYHTVLAQHAKVQVWVEALNMTFDMDEPGVPLTFTLPSGVHSAITATRPVSVYTFAPDLTTIVDPCMTTPLPRHLWRRDYTFTVLPTATGYVTVVIPSPHKDCLRLNGNVVAMTWTYFHEAKMAGTSFELPNPGPHAVTCSNSTFGLHIYGYGSYETYCMPAGIQSPSSCLEEASTLSGAPSSSVRITMSPSETTNSYFSASSATEWSTVATSELSTSALASAVSSAVDSTFTPIVADSSAYLDSMLTPTFSSDEVPTSSMSSGVSSYISAVGGSTTTRGAASPSTETSSIDQSVSLSDFTMSAVMNYTEMSDVLSSAVMPSIPSLSFSTSKSPSHASTLVESSSADETSQLSVMDHTETSDLSSSFVTSSVPALFSSTLASPSQLSTLIESSSTYEASQALTTSSVLSMQPTTTNFALAFSSFATSLLSSEARFIPTVTTPANPPSSHHISEAVSTIPSLPDFAPTSAVVEASQPTTQLALEATEIFVTSTPSTPEVSPGLCSCRCTGGATSASVEETKLHEIAQEMSVDKKRLSSYVRTKLSAGDERVSSKVMGVGGIAIILASGLVLVCSDVVRLYQWRERKSKRQPIREDEEDLD